MKKNRWQWLIVATGLLIAVRQGASVWKLYRAGEQVHQAQEQLSQEEAQNQKLKQKLAEIDNPQFIEREAREKLGYSKEGETILILPQQDQQSQRVTESEKPSWEQWWDLYIRI